MHNESLAIVLFVLLLLPAQMLSILIHELGHFIAFRLQKVTPMWVAIGTGPFWFKFRYKGSWINVHKIPLVGEVAVAPGHIKKIGLRGALTTLLAGPIFHGTFAVLLFVASSVFGPENTHGMTFHYLGVWVAVQAAYQLLPIRTTRTRNGKTFEIRSDGFQIRNFWRRRAQFAVKNDNW